MVADLVSWVWGWPCLHFVWYNAVRCNRSNPTIKGRGSADNPPNRFEKMHVEDDFEHFEGDAEFLEELGKVTTEYFVDTSRSIDSPDVGFSHSLNAYRGCSHGLRGGKLNDPNFNTRMRGQGIWAEQLKMMFDHAKRKAGFDLRTMPKLSTDSFRNVGQKQMTLW
jgi:hypothetical protein